ncbi:fimbria/pilus outer membrane usher protein [Ramlibacter sp. MAHUQ-53]|uniref:fimbria/pilus outer membrane usher protein n=1 Tax=unclassified Ramlibacter TaxID=2617605 RepID=UPI003624B69F
MPVTARAGALLLALAASLAAMPARAQPEPMVLAVTVNSERRGDLFVLREPDGRLLLRQDDLPALGLQPPPEAARVQVDGEAHLHLDRLAGLSWTLDERALRLDLLAEPRLLARTAVDAANRAPRLEQVGQASGFLNWAIQHTRGDVARAGPTYSLEGGARLGPVLLQATGHTATVGSRRFIRHATSLTVDRPQDLQRWTAGDLFTTPAELGGGVALGGLSVSRHAGLDPYRRHHPLGVVQGQASLPSEVEVYVDGQRVRSERVRPGEFEIRDLDLRPGARDVQVLVRDPFGRTTTTPYAFYASPELLRPGLHDYQYAIGALRRRLGEAGSDYGAPAFSAWHRRGLSDALTLGAHAQGRGGLLHAGPMATARLGAAGVLSATAAWSRWAGRPGRALSLRYQYEAEAWAAGAAWRHESAGYAVLAEPVAPSHRRNAIALHASRSWPQAGTLSISRTRQTVHEAPAGDTAPWRSPRDATALGYSVFLPQWRAGLRAGIARVRDDRGPHLEVRLGLTLLLDDRRTATLETRQAGGESHDALQLRRHLPAGPGWGYDLAAERLRPAGGVDADEAWRAEAQYQGSQALLRGGWQRAGAQDELRLSASGGIAWVDGRAYLARPIRDGFIVARVGQALAQVPVTLGGEVVGTSDGRGEVLLPEVAAFREAEVGIDPQGLPIDHTVPRLQRRVVLPARTGAVVDFGAIRVRAVSTRLRDSRGPVAVLPVRIDAAGLVIETLTGSDGTLYLENLPPGRHAGVAGVAPAACAFTLDVPAGDELLADLGELRCAP